MIKTRIDRPDTRALVLSMETRDWTVTGLSVRKHFTARENHLTGCPEKCRSFNDAVSWGRRVTGWVKVNCRDGSQVFYSRAKLRVLSTLP